MRKRANYEIVRDVLGDPLIIRDVGPHYAYLTVTNAAEKVVAELYNAGRLFPGDRRLFYYDSDGGLDEITHKDGVFTGFLAGTKERA